MGTDVEDGCTFIQGSRPSARRIPDNVWEKYRPTLVHLYRTTTLPEVIRVMEREHHFFATKRQYVHRFQVWNIKKYKQDQDTSIEDSTQAPLDWVPQLSSADDRARHLWLADMLFVLGDFHHSFAINAALGPWENSHDYAVTCVRTAQAQAQAELARNLVKASLPFPAEQDDAWNTTLSEFLLAYTYDWGRDAEHGLEQIARTVTDMVLEDAQGRDCLKELAPRGQFLDVLAYVLFRAGLVRYNQQQHQDGEIDTSEVLRQFLSQQPALQHGQDMKTDPLLHINPISSCLGWCKETLKNNPDICRDITGGDDNPIAEAYTLLCALWSLWLGCRPSSPMSCRAEAIGRYFTSVPAWAYNSKQQLGIAPTELLSTVVCMIMVAVPQLNKDIRQSLRERALASAHALEALRSEDLILRFLDQVWATNERLAFRADGPQGSRHDAVYVEMVETARRFVAESLGIYNLPVLEHGTAVYPLILADCGLFICSY
ncbi:hypothetical protein N657DRAFT_569667 [Parathielavia appendiculata]|uniref:Clr5 domain-containing protein n=1 Tax=Parathielavia appendiculata TaxID=2587402 RepID=A0AAN6U3T3_9PEZI|nr:hypothetical protein N657DRAFT_569667 [Parathielavia appendiculata]